MGVDAVKARILEELGDADLALFRNLTLHPFPIEGNLAQLPARAGQSGR